MPPSKVPFLDLHAMNQEVRSPVLERWAQLWGTSAFVGGEQVERFEQRWASYCGVDHALGVASGPDAIELVLRALGVGKGDEVVVPANTFVATAEAVIHAGARPHFVDVDPDTLLLTPDGLQAAVGPKTTAVIAVHLYGQPADMSGLRAMCASKGLALIEDGAQAHGARWQGQPVGGLGDAAAFSFYPGKNLGAMGDAGAAVTNDEAVARRIRSLANHGRGPGDGSAHERLGCNSRLDAMQAAVLDVKLDHLDRWNRDRRRVAADYAQLLPPDVRQTHIDPRAEAVHHLEVVRVQNRDLVRTTLDAKGIGTGIHYRVPCHGLAFLDAPSTRLAVAERAADEILSLPMYPHLVLDDIERVCAALSEERTAA